MNGYWNGKTVLVTGGSSGLGRIIAERFGAAGANLAVVGLESEPTARAAEELAASGTGVLPLVGNVTRQDDVERFVAETAARFGRIDALVNAAGRTDRGRITEIPPDEILALFELNTLSAVRMTREALPYLIQAKGHVVNIGSLAAKSASRWVGAYPITKFGLAAFSQQLRLETKSFGLHVLLVCPGPVKRENPRLYPLRPVADENAALSGAEKIPDSALLPGAGVKVGKIDPVWLADRILTCCEKRKPELVVPRKARLLFALAALFPALGDWIVLKKTS